MNAGDLITLFENLRRAGSGWSARCPAHADRENSLSLRIGEDGRLLVNCFARCRAAEIVAAVGLELRDLFPQQERRPRPHRRPASPRSAMDEARQAILREARRQAWARPGVLELYQLADRLRFADAAPASEAATLRTAALATFEAAMQAAIAAAFEAALRELALALDGVAA